jgi:hypothetical protein
LPVGCVPGEGAVIGVPCRAMVGAGLAAWAPLCCWPFSRATMLTQGPIPCSPEGSDPLHVATACVTVLPHTTGFGLPVAAVAAAVPPTVRSPAAARPVMALAVAVVTRDETDMRLLLLANAWYTD